MSTRLVISKLLKHGKQVFQNAVRHKFGKVPAGDVKATARNDGVITNVLQPRKQLLLGRIFPLIPVRCLASELRRRAATRLVSPVWPTFAFAFAGLTLQQHHDHEEDSLSSEVRNIFCERLGSDDSILNKVQQLSLDVFELGKMIGQGSNAAVYEARLKPACHSDYASPKENMPSIVTLSTDTESDFVVLDHDNDFSGLEDVDDDLVVYSHGDDLEDSDIFILHQEEVEDGGHLLSDLQGVDHETVMEVGLQNNEMTKEATAPDVTEVHGLQNMEDYNLAIKMMYNYDIESNAEAIMRAMLKEAIPARMSTVASSDHQLWQNGNRVRLKTLEPHPNIVEMVGVFVDPVPNLPEALEHYPAAIPHRLNPHGLGRNQTMFLVMKKYDLTLRQYLAQEELSAHTRCILLCQLLEGAVHLNKRNIAHRDMKSDNILLDCHSDSGPNLVISDFGCCLVDEDNGLTLPYPTDEINKGGNGALMPPEISCTAPGRHVELDYSKSDLWAIGSMAYEVFGEDNPFYGGSRTVRKLEGRTYQDGDLSPFSGDVPDVIRFLIPRLLRRNPKQRPTATMAANLLQIFLHFPDWLHPGNQPSRKVITECLMILVTRVLIGWKWRCQGSFNVMEQLELTFLRRLVITDLVYALDYYHSN